VTFWEFMYWLVTNNHLEEVVGELRSGGCPDPSIMLWITLAQSHGGRALHPSQLPGAQTD
jgi:hypothetical protein